MQTLRIVVLKINSPETERHRERHKKTDTNTDTERQHRDRHRDTGTEKKNTDIERRLLKEGNNTKVTYNIRANPAYCRALNQIA